MRIPRFLISHSVQGTSARDPTCDLGSEGICDCAHELAHGKPKELRYGHLLQSKELSCQRVLKLPLASTEFSAQRSD